MSVSIVISGVTSAQWVKHDDNAEHEANILRVTTENGNVQEIVLWKARKAEPRLEKQAED